MLAVSVFGRIREVLDVRAGLVGATLMAVIVFAINYGHGGFGASTAAAKQWVYTFFVGGFIVQLATRLAVRPGHAAVSIGLAILAPTLIATALTLALHSTRGTPRPLASTIPVLLISPPSLFGWALRARKADRLDRSPWERLSKEEA